MRRGISEVTASILILVGGIVLAIVGGALLCSVLQRGSPSSSAPPVMIGCDAVEIEGYPTKVVCVVRAMKDFEGGRLTLVSGSGVVVVQLPPMRGGEARAVILDVPEVPSRAVLPDGTVISVERSGKHAPAAASRATATTSATSAA